MRCKECQEEIYPNHKNQVYCKRKDCVTKRKARYKERLRQFHKDLKDYNKMAESKLVWVEKCKCGKEFFPAITGDRCVDCSDDNIRIKKPRKK